MQPSGLLAKAYAQSIAKLFVSLSTVGSQAFVIFSGHLMPRILFRQFTNTWSLLTDDWRFLFRKKKNKQTNTNKKKTPPVLIFRGGTKEKKLK